MTYRRFKTEIPVVGVKGKMAGDEKNFSQYRHMFLMISM
jgi:hypothetical protein